MGMGQILTTRGQQLVLVVVSIYQGKPFWVPIFDHPVALVPTCTWNHWVWLSLHRAFTTDPLELLRPRGLIV